MKHWKRRIRNERGSQLIEFLAVFPMIAMALLFIWQMALVAYTIVVTEAAARDGARVAAVGGDHQTTVERSAHGLDVTVGYFTGTDESGGEEVTVTVTASVPTIRIPLVGEIDLPVTADATMRKEDD